MSTDDSLPDDVTTLKAMLLAERAARTAAEAASQAQTLMIEKLKFASPSSAMNGSVNPRSGAH